MLRKAIAPKAHASTTITPISAASSTAAATAICAAPTAAASSADMHIELLEWARVWVIVKALQLPSLPVQSHIVEACDGEATVLLAAVHKELLLPAHVDDWVPLQLPTAATVLDHSRPAQADSRQTAGRCSC